MKTINWIIIALFSFSMLMTESVMAQRNGSCTVPSTRNTRGYSNIGDVAFNTQRFRRERNPYLGTYYKNNRRMPRRADRIRHGGNTFFYLDGLFYLERRRGFMVVNPPLGIRLDRRPANAERVRYRKRVYFHAGTYWFVKDKRGNDFVLVRNPFR
ncbi:MAG: hypothetical protein MRZ79_13565 [Bacteroidia bacterium]|nr:hypothetical protein [Bacteroidia bacterium]